MGIKKNFVYNATLTVSQYIIALLIFPYISRIFGVTNIGILGFVDNTLIISFFFQQWVSV